MRKERKGVHTGQAGCAILAGAAFVAGTRRGAGYTTVEGAGAGRRTEHCPRPGPAHPALLDGAQCAAPTLTQALEGARSIAPALALRTLPCWTEHSALPQP